MPLYDYLCNTCLAEATRIKGSSLTDEEQLECMFETRHAMNPSLKESVLTTECPRCGGHDTVKTYNGVKLTTYVRGKGYLDRAGCQRDMNLYKLIVPDEDGKSQDPYLGMRENGETDELAHKIRQGGKHQVNTKYFPTPNAGVADAVKDIKSII